MRSFIGSYSRNFSIYLKEDQYVSCVYIYEIIINKFMNETQLMVNELKLLALFTILQVHCH
jgi:hypothetical protein